jgi:hypothetical protein
VFWKSKENLFCFKKQAVLFYFLLAFWSHWNSQLGDKFVTQIQLGRRTCRPSRAEKGPKDWAIGAILLTKGHTCQCHVLATYVHY